MKPNLVSGFSKQIQAIKTKQTKTLTETGFPWNLTYILKLLNTIAEHKKTLKVSPWIIMNNGVFIYFKQNSFILSFLPIDFFSLSFATHHGWGGSFYFISGTNKFGTFLQIQFYAYSSLLLLHLPFTTFFYVLLPNFPFMWNNFKRKIRESNL